MLCDILLAYLNKECPCIHKALEQLHYAKEKVNAGIRSCIPVWDAFGFVYRII